MKFDHFFVAPNNWQRSLEFYEKTMGCRVVDRWGDQPGTQGAVLRNDGFCVVIAEEHDDKGDDAWKPGKGINGHQPTLHITVENVDEVYNSIQDKSVVTIPPVNNHWGSRWMVIQDPDRNLIALNSPQK